MIFHLNKLSVCGLPVVAAVTYKQKKTNQYKYNWLATNFLVWSCNDYYDIGMINQFPNKKQKQANRITKMSCYL